MASPLKWFGANTASGAYQAIVSVMVIAIGSALLKRVTGLPLHWAIVLGLAVGLVAALIANLISLMAMRHRGPRASEPSQHQCPDSWLHDIAVGQGNALRDSVDVDCQIAAHKLTGDNPYIDFQFTVRSHCVYKISLSDEVGGFVPFGNTRLAQPPVLANNGVRDLGINKTAYFTIHQQLTDREAASLLSEQGTFSFYGLLTKMSGKPGLDEQRFELPCLTSINQAFVDANYPKLNIKIEPQSLRTYFAYNERELPSKPLGTIVNLNVWFKNWRPLKVRQFKLVTSGPVVVAETGEIRSGPYRGHNGRSLTSGDELYPNLADATIDIDRDNPQEGWLQFIVKEVAPQTMLNPANFVVRLHIVDESTEEHRQDVLGLIYDP